MKKILIADDDVALRKVLVEKFTKEGWGAVAAVDGEETLAEVTKDTFDIVLLDLRMPHKDGFEVLEELKSHPLNPPPVILVLSNSGDEEDIKRAISLGATDYFVKADDPLEKILKWATIYSGTNGVSAEEGKIPHRE